MGTTTHHTPTLATGSTAPSPTSPTLRSVLTSIAPLTCSAHSAATLSLLFRRANAQLTPHTGALMTYIPSASAELTSWTTSYKECSCGPSAMNLSQDGATQNPTPMAGSREPTSHQLTLRNSSSEAITLRFESSNAQVLNCYIN